MVFAPLMGVAALCSLQLLSVVLVLLFGEIIPQALCKAHSLAIGAYTAPFSALRQTLTLRAQCIAADRLCAVVLGCAVRIIMFVLWPLAKPIAVLLDLLLGSVAKPSTYRRYDLMGDEQLGDLGNASAEVLVGDRP